MGIFTKTIFSTDNANVQNFGAKGDGTTDDTEAIRDAISHAESTGKTLFFPQGTYMVSDTLEVTNSLTLQMAKGSTSIKASDTFTTGVDPIIWIKNNAEIIYLELDGNNRASGICFGAVGASGNNYAETVKAFNISQQFTTLSADLQDASKLNTTASIPGFGVAFMGFNHKVQHIEAVDGQAGVLLKSASDVYMHSVLSVHCFAGLWVDGCEHVFGALMDLDSSRDHGIQSFSNRDVHLKGTIWYNETSYSPATDTPVRGINMDGDKGCVYDFTMWACAPTGAKLRNVTDCRFKFHLTNASLYTETGGSPDVAVTLTTGLDLDTTVANSNKITYTQGSSLTLASITGAITDPSIFENIMVTSYKETSGTVGFGSTRYFPLEGTDIAIAAESNADIRLLENVICIGLSVTSRINGLNGTQVVTLRDDGIATSTTCTIAAGDTAENTDYTNRAGISKGSYVNTEIVYNGTAGTAYRHDITVYFLKVGVI